MKKIIIFVASLLLIVSCTPQTEEVGAPFYKGQEVVLSAMIADAATPTGPQRISGKDHNPSNIEGSVVTLTWDEGDRVLVKVGDASATFRLLDGAGTSAATIRGEMPAEGSSYDVFYPVTYNESVLDEQNYVENGFEKGLVKMSTKTPGTLGGGFTMSADNALLGLQLTGEDELGKIVLTNSATSKTYTLNCAGVTLTDAATLFYIVVPAGEWTSGFSVEIYGSDANTKLATFAKTSSASFVAGNAMIMPKQEVAGIGFSIDDGKKVLFSPGNLQYTQSTNTWSFAENQWDCIGTNNVTDGSIESYPGGDNKIGTALADKIDLFGWSGSTGSEKFGVSTSEDDADYSGEFVDWGTNQIGDDAPNTWRTLTRDEWGYLLEFRTNASSLVGVAQVNGVNGLILLPDNWICPDGVTFKSGFNTENGVDYYAAYQTFNAGQWSKMEQAGAVFLPAAGERSGTSICCVRGYIEYWSATEINLAAYNIQSTSRKIFNTNTPRRFGLSVRLVKDL